MRARRSPDSPAALGASVAVLFLLTSLAFLALSFCTAVREGERVGRPGPALMRNTGGKISRSVRWRGGSVDQWKPRNNKRRLRSRWTESILSVMRASQANSPSSQTPSVPFGLDANCEGEGGARRSESGLEAIVVGAGVGGLAVAARLKNSGAYKKVTVFEKNDKKTSGVGRMGEIRLMQDGAEGSDSSLSYRFETGPSLMLLPDVYRKTFSDLGFDLDSFVEIKRVMPAFKVHFDDGVSVTLSDDEEDMRQQLNSLETEGYEKYLRYMSSANINLDAGLPLFIQEDLATGLPKLPQFIFNALAHWPLKGHHAQLGEFFETDRLKALFSFQDLYIGLSPYEAPGVFSLLQSIELSRGVYYPVGGFSKIGQGLKKVCQDLGVDIHYSSPVGKIVVNDKKQAIGVELLKAEENILGQSSKNANFVGANTVVVNADVPFAERHLMEPKFRRWEFQTNDSQNDKDAVEKRRLKYSSSVVEFCWGVKKRYDDHLGHHSIFLSTNYRKSWDGLFSDTKENKEKGRRRPPSDHREINFYVHTPSRTDPSCCPKDHDSIMVLVPVPPIDESDSEVQLKSMEDELVAKVREAVIRRFEDIGMKDFREMVVAEEIRTPSEWRELYSLRRGSVFGLSHPMSQLSVFRPAPKHPIVDNLYFVGASTRPGNGVPLVLIGAEKIAEDMVQNLPSETTAA